MWGLRREAAQQPIVISHSGHRIFFKLQIGVPADQISQIKAVNPATNPSYLYVLDPKYGETTPVMNRALASQVREFMAKELGESDVRFVRA